MDAALARLQEIVRDLRQAAELVVAAAQELRMQQTYSVPQPPPDREALRLSRLARQITETIPVIEKLIRERTRS